MRTLLSTFVLIGCVISFPAMSQWSTTGNSGTTPGTNFVGTTSNVGLMFKVNSVQSGYIDIANTNTSFGYSTMSVNTGTINTAFGTGAMNSNTTGSNNLAIGTYALFTQTTTSYNMAIGRQAMTNSTTGTMNTALGYQGLFSNTTGSYNSIYGFQTGYDNTTGGSNTYFGYNTGRGITTGSYNTVIGANVTGLSASLNNHVIIADGQGHQRIDIDSLGDVGIGTTTPSAQLHTTGTVLFAGLPVNSAPTNVIVSDASGHIGYEAVSSFSGGGSSSWSTSGSNIHNSNTGVVIVGAIPTVLFSDPNLKLAVNGDIYSQKVVVTATGWSDYVFDPGYKLISLKELEAFVIKNRHLPDMPSASDVEKGGIDVGSNQNVLLKKVEELTLYSIEQSKKTEAQQKIIDDQYKMLVEMKAEIEELKKHHH
jgi:trimeric autotransporter adhesin